MPTASNDNESPNDTKKGNDNRVTRTKGVGFMKYRKDDIRRAEALVGTYLEVRRTRRCRQYCTLPPHTPTSRFSHEIFAGAD
jgi:hypothetical protein